MFSFQLNRNFSFCSALLSSFAFLQFKLGQKSCFNLHSPCIFHCCGTWNAKQFHRRQRFTLNIATGTRTIHMDSFSVTYPSGFWFHMACTWSSNHMHNLCTTNYKSPAKCLPAKAIDKRNSSRRILKTSWRPSSPCSNKESSQGKRSTGTEHCCRMLAQWELGQSLKSVPIPVSQTDEWLKWYDGCA